MIFIVNATIIVLILFTYWFFFMKKEEEATKAKNIIKSFENENSSRSTRSNTNRSHILQSS